ncbi:hypothetical protein M117_4878 [Bacteroides fragilis str. 3774 T13]|nr:hypothetical protein M117_4878 [Bacteroides fragilis str. 3774 T13]
MYRFHKMWKRYTDFLQLPPAGVSPGGFLHLHIYQKESNIGALHHKNS